MVVEFRFGGSKFDHFMKNWIKEAVRVDGGGSVDVAFG
jgi:hypothetical protein